MLDHTQTDSSDHPLVLLQVTSPLDVRAHRWELVDPWAAPSGRPEAVVTARRTREVVRVLTVEIVSGAPAGTVRTLVQQLVVALRRTDAAVVSCSIADPVVRRELVAAGFVQLPDENQDGRTVADRLILQLS